MRLGGKKTKTGSLGLFISGLLTLGTLVGVPFAIPVSIALFSFAIIIYGFYDRTVKNHQNRYEEMQKQSKTLEEWRGRFKKPPMM
jgi:dolichol kinase